jgi:hypothetical protein
MGIARQQQGKHVSAAKNKHATIEEFLEAVFSTWCMLRFYNEDQLDEPESRQSVKGQSVVSRQS